MDCELMESVATYKPLLIALITVFLVSVLTLPLVSYFIIRISRNPLYHINTKVLLIAHSIAIVVHLVSRIFYCGIELYRFLILLPISSSACDIMVSSERCFVLRLGVNIGIFFTICTSPAITLERYLATRNISTYQKDRTSWCFLLILYFVHSLIILGLLYAETSFGQPAHYCLAASTTFPRNSLLAFSIEAIAQSVSLLVYRKLMRKNQKLKNELQAHGGELTKRYQVEETLRSLRTLFQPVLIMFIFQFSYSILAFLVIKFNYIFERPAFYFAMEAIIFIPEYSIIFIVLFIKKDNRIRHQRIRALNLKINMKADVYFENYKKSWS